MSTAHAQGSAMLARSFRAPSAQTEQPWDQLASWLRTTGHEVDDLRPKQFAGGVANLTYRVHIDGGCAPAAYSERDTDLRRFRRPNAVDGGWSAH